MDVCDQKEIDITNPPEVVYEALDTIVDHLGLVMPSNKKTALSAIVSMYLLLGGDKETLREYIEVQNRMLALPSDVSFFGPQFDDLLQHIMDFNLTAKDQQSVTHKEQPATKINRGLERVVAQLPLEEKDRQIVQNALAKHCLMFLPGGENKLEWYAREHLDLKNTDKICNQTFQGLDYDLLVLREAHERLDKETIDDIKSDYGHGCDGNCDCDSDEDF